MMTVQEIWKDLLVRSGRFILEPSNVKLNQERLVPLVEDALRFFSKYNPCSTKFNLSMPSTDFGGQFTFTDSFSANGDLLGIPDMVTDVVPIRLFGSVPTNFHLIQTMKNFLQGSSDVSMESIKKTAFPTEYRKPTLYAPIGGDFDVQATFIPKVMRVENQWVITQVQKYDPNWHNFFELLDGLFLVALGRSQRAFTIEDLPIRTDADSIISEGLQLEEKARQDIIENDHAWYLAWS